MLEPEPTARASSARASPRSPRSARRRAPAGSPLSPLLFGLLEAIDGERGADELAAAIVLLVAGLGVGSGVLSAAAGGSDTANQRSYVGASGPLSGTQSHQLLERQRAR